MRLYSFQDSKVIALVHEQGIYTPDWEQINFKSKEAWGDGFENAYLWLIDQYNERKGTNYFNPPVFWYTDLKQIQGVLKHEPKSSGEVLLFADVPDSEVLLHNFHMWGDVINHFPITLQDDWLCNQFPDLADKHLDACFEGRIKDKEVQLWVKETWKHIFHIPRCKKDSFDVHAVTGCIKKEWLLI